MTGGITRYFNLELIFHFVVIASTVIYTTHGLNQRLERTEKKLIFTSQIGIRMTNIMTINNCN